ncbi:MAG TPA: 4-hydroxy-tetrahydrodipicolinate synthase [Firmicutes bacterium]|nr:4-hydroxy-tetrahydrodipicolinate synthase [Candidatus Fermentithermobacillaceae bacterium]
MRLSPYGSLIVALVTPFDENSQVNYKAAVGLARKLVSHGVDGILISGTTGESPTLTAGEKIRLVSEVREALDPSTMVWAGASSYNTGDSVEMAKLVEKAGADGILAVTPYYNKPDQEGLYRHFRAISEAVSLPIMLYNVPPRTSVNLLPGTVLRLSELKNIVAIKEASGILDQTSAILESCGDDFYVFSGDDSLTLPILALGGSGVVSVAAHLVASDMKNMIDFYAEGKIQEAQAVHYKLFKLFKTLFITTNPVPVKTALEMTGVQVGGFRLPLCPPEPKDKEVIRQVLGKMRLL